MWRVPDVITFSKKRPRYSKVPIILVSTQTPPLHHHPDRNFTALFSTQGRGGGGLKRPRLLSSETKAPLLRMEISRWGATCCTFENHCNVKAVKNVPIVLEGSVKMISGCACNKNEGKTNDDLTRWMATWTCVEQRGVIFRRALTTCVYVLPSLGQVLHLARGTRTHQPHHQAEFAWHKAGLLRCAALLMPNVKLLGCVKRFSLFTRRNPLN